MAKLTLGQLIEIAQSAGVPHVEVVDEKDADKEYTLEANLSLIDASRGAILKPAYKQELESGLAASITGAKTGNLISALIKEFGIERKELEAITKNPDFKTADLLAKAKELSSAKYSQDTEGLRNELTNATTTHQQALEAIKSDYEGRLSSANQKYIDRDIESTILEVLKDAPLPEKSNRLSLAKQLKAHLNENAHIHYDEVTKAISLRDKANKELPLLTTAKTEIKILDKAKEFFTDLGVWQTNTTSINPSDVMNRMQTQGLQNINTGNIRPNSKEAIDKAYADKLSSVQIPASTAK